MLMLIFLPNSTACLMLPIGHMYAYQHLLAQLLYILHLSAWALWCRGGAEESEGGAAHRGRDQHSKGEVPHCASARLPSVLCHG